MQLGHSLFKKLDAARIPARAKQPIGRLIVLVQDFGRCDLLKQASAMA